MGHEKFIITKHSCNLNRSDRTFFKYIELSALSPTFSLLTEFTLIFITYVNQYILFLYAFLFICMVLSCIFEFLHDKKCCFLSKIFAIPMHGVAFYLVFYFKHDLIMHEYDQSLNRSIYHIWIKSLFFTKVCF